MGDAVRSLTFKAFSPGKYPNPALQGHYRIIQAMALEEDLPEDQEDTTVPKYSKIHERVGPSALEWLDVLDREAPVGRVEAPKKRKAVTNGKEGGSVERKVKREKKAVEPPSVDKIESLYEQGNLMTVISPSLPDLLVS